AQEAVERPPERPERVEVRPGQGVRLGGPAAGVQHRVGAGARRVRRVRRPGREGEAAHTGRRGGPHTCEPPGQVPGPRRRGRRGGVARGLDADKVEAYRAERDYEGLEMYVLQKLMGK